MRVVIQRVKRAHVTVDGKIIGSINQGYVLLVGFCVNDTEHDIDKCAQKIINLRIMGDNEGHMNKSIVDVNGEILVVSQFTLCANLSGRRPDFLQAMKYKDAEKLYHCFIQKLKENSIMVQQGIFGAMMDVEFVNNGPVTIIFDSKQNN